MGIGRPTSRVPVRRAATALVLAAVVLAAGAPVALADEATGLGDVLHRRWSDAPAVWRGSCDSATFDGPDSNRCAYLFGGFRDGQRTDAVAHVAVEASLPHSRELRAKFPAALSGVSAAAAGSVAYALGGADGSRDGVRWIFRYDFWQDTLTYLGDLPWGRADASAVWTGSHVYLFGGRNANCAESSFSTNRCYEIVRFDPATGSSTVMAARLPGAWHGTSAVWTGQHALVFGGFTSSGLKTGGCTTYCDAILRYDPVADTLQVANARLPTGRGGTAAFWDGTHAYVVGGFGASGEISEIVRYDPSADEVAVMGAALPSGRAFAAAVWTGESAYVIGGRARLDGAWTGLRDVVHYDLTPGPPSDVRAATGPGIGQVRLTWEAPAPESYSRPITGYRLYRSVDGDAPRLFAEVGDVRAHTDTACPLAAICAYTVAAVNGHGEGPASASVAALGTSVLGVVLNPAVRLDEGGATVFNDEDADGSQDPDETAATVAP